MRVANVFTAVADVWMGLILTTGGLNGLLAIGITATSALLYLAGMVLNDLFDHKIDAVERPTRPIPSGHVSLPAARRLGWGLLVAGLVTGWATAAMASTPVPGLAAAVLAGLILLYNRGAKSTRHGPMVMGFCRACNVVLGMSLTTEVSGNGYPVVGSLVPALGIGLYIVGVSWFARSEAGESHRGVLAIAAAISMAGLALLAAMPHLDASPDLPLRVQTFGWYLLWIFVAATILRRMLVAILQPRPKFVQRAVGHAILSIIMIDASIVLGYVDSFWACAILLLLVPATLLAQRLKVT